MSNAQDRLKELTIDRTLSDAPSSGKNLLLGLLTLLLVVAAASGWLWYRRSTTPVVRTAAAEQVASAGGPVAATVLDASGYVTARRRATVSSKITAKIVEVHVEEGLEVEQGQVLARLDDSTPARQLALTESQLRAAQSALAETEVRIAEAELAQRRAAELVAAEVSSQSQLDATQANTDSLRARLASQRSEVEVAERAVALNRQQVEDTIIRAPFAGVVVTKDAQPGEMISPVSAGGGFTRTGICTVVDMSSLEIEVDVNEAYINRVRAGQKVQATLDAYPDWTIPATVITPIPTADRQKATVLVRIAFDQLDPRILPDMGIKVSFLAEPNAETGSAPPPRVVVPKEALRKSEGKDVVLVLDDERLERRAVTVGGKIGEKTEITAGLRAGEQVVIEGPADLADGQKVRLELAP